MKAVPLLLGIDVGTQGVRVVIAEARGRAAAQAARAFTFDARLELPAGQLEQEPEAWWQATSECIRQVLAQLKDQGRRADEIHAGSVASTSGTVVLLDANNQPVRPALMYNDRRAQQEADEVNQVGNELCQKLGYRFNSSFALPKILWVMRNEPEVWRKTRRIAHAADYIVGKLTGKFDTSDQSNALKTGFDLVDFEWSPFIERALGIELEKLPRVLLSGDSIGRVSKACAEETGLSTRTRIVAGMTDGSADQVASGAHAPGDWNSVIGTTLILKGVTTALLRDPEGRVYCHLHPLGYWMPGGASNVGAKVLDERFPDVDKRAFDAAALGESPTRLVVYPLTVKGERFPFVRPDAEGFIEGSPDSQQELYAAHLEGIGFVERLGYDTLRSLGAEVGTRIYTTGGGARSVEWLQLRADILGCELARAENPQAAMGAAIIAGSRTLFMNLAVAVGQMVKLDRVVSPRPELVPRYQDSYEKFLRALQRRGYV